MRNYDLGPLPTDTGSPASAVRVKELEAAVSSLKDWILAKLKTLGEYYQPPTDGRDAIQEIYGWMHVLCFHYIQNRRDVKEYDAARRRAKELEAEVERLKAELREAQMDQANYRGLCDTCETANCDMLTDTYCAQCEVNRLRGFKS